MDKDSQKLIRFVDALSSIGIKLELQANYPWIYIVSINGNRIAREEWTANHGYILGYWTVWTGGEFKFNNLPRTFKLIRKYSKLIPPD